LEQAAVTWADLHYPDEDGTTKFDRLSHLENATGKPHLPEILIPVDVQYLWDWFMDLNNARQSGFGISPISYMELQAWAHMTGVQPTIWEVQVLKRIDLHLVGMINELSQRKTRTKQIGTQKPTKRIM